MTKAPRRLSLFLPTTGALSDLQVIRLYHKPLNEVVQLLEGRGYELQKISLVVGFHNKLDIYLHPHRHKIVIYHDGETVKKARGYYKRDPELEAILSQYEKGE